MSKKSELQDQDAIVNDEMNDAHTENHIETEGKESLESSEISQLETVEKELQLEKDRYLRLFAEFENYKKRTAKERIDLFKTAGESVITAMLPVLDDFDRALKEYSGEEDDVHVQGMTLISNKLKETLRQKGLEVVETEVGQVFNADDHEAITQIPAPSEDMKGKIIDVVEKGYALGEKIIRYPKVVIGN